MDRAVYSRIPELLELERLLEQMGSRARVQTLGQVHHKEISFPLYAISIGSTDPAAPTLGMFGGVHGLERIGTQVILSYLRTLSEFMRWDHAVASLLERSRMVFLPITNPGGMYLMSRSNPQGVDLMRNAPVHADKTSALALYSGHRLSPRLPWYRGPAGAPMEVESTALCDLVRKEIFPSKVAITLDVHSGFGTRDRVWFPYAKTARPFAGYTDAFAIKDLLDRTYPNHVYIVEPQSRQYTAHGDLWDYLYDEHRKRESGGVFLPMTLEMGSWIWAKKNVRQMFSLLGAFHPIKPHRLQRTLRRHLLFLDFLHRAVICPEQWAFLPEEKKDPLKRRALELWYSP